MARIFLLAVLLLSLQSFGQVREIPTPVKDAFSKQYPSVDSVTYEDNLVSVQVHFLSEDKKMVAAYTNKGKWKETQEDSDYETLNEEIKKGFDKSKYADWKVLDTKIIRRPGDVTLYRIKVEKSDIQKKHLFFNKSGRLVSDTITL
jgi:hypothetical protein